MPELPEVETVRRDLAASLTSVRVLGVWSSGLPLRLRRLPRLEALRAAAVGRRLLAVERAGKYLLLDFDGGGRIVIHLGMSGQLLVAPAEEARLPHTHIVFSLSGGRELRFVDPRRFGSVDACAHGRLPTGLARLGVEPLAGGLTAARLLELVRGHRCTLKSFLLDQRHIAGIGNIYACEALHEARLHPALPAARLGRRGAARLCNAIRSVLDRAITNRGTSFRDFVDARGRSGANQRTLRVYGRDGESCPRGDGTIRRVTISGRGTYFCPRCQRM